MNNILSNATKHNYEGGSISVELYESHLRVANTSKIAVLENASIFQRFYRPAQAKDYNGLGLSIIKQICEASGFSKTYHYLDSMHVFTVGFA